MAKEDCAEVNQLLLDANRHARRHALSPSQLERIAADVRKHGHAIAELLSTRLLDARRYRSRTWLPSNPADAT